MRIDKIKINGYKRFDKFELEFNKNINVIIGENEAGKSTILEAIEIVLNQKIFSFTNNVYEQFFSIKNVEFFKGNPIYDNLPVIKIELFFEDNEDMSVHYFNGFHSSESDMSKNGISFIYKFDDSFRSVFEEISFNEHGENIFIPTDYYIAEWKTFAGHKYNKRKSPLRSLMIDNSMHRNNIFDSYTRQVFTNSIPITDRSSLSLSLKDKLSQFLSDNVALLQIGDHSLGLDEKKTYIEQLVDLKNNGISIQNMGKGRENLIKTEIALEKTADLILLEEPENHLSFTNTRKLIEDIRERHRGVQVIMTTHSPLIVSRIDLTNTIWINQNTSCSLRNLSKDTAEFFQKTDNLNILNFILSRKAILVEGNSEYILLPYLIKDALGYTVDKQGIEILSGGGITYEHYVNVSKIIKNKLLVITDNDGVQEKVESISEQNKLFEEQMLPIMIKCDDNTEKFTFEVCLYEENKKKLENISQSKPRTQSEYKGRTYERNLAYMLKNKTEAALKISKEYKDLSLPKYIKEGIEWLIQE